MRRDSRKRVWWLPPSITSPAAARGQTARSGVRRARAPSSAPPPARPRAPARAHSRPPLCGSSIRYVQNGPSAAAAARGGRGRRGRGGGARPGGRGRAAPAGKGLGRGAGPPSGATRATVRVGSALGPGPPPPPTPFCKTIPAILLLPSGDSWKGANPEGPPSSSVLFPSQNPEPQTQERTAPAAPPSLSVPTTLSSFCVNRPNCNPSPLGLPRGRVPARCSSLTLLLPPSTGGQNGPQDTGAGISAWKRPASPCPQSSHRRV